MSRRLIVLAALALAARPVRADVAAEPPLASETPGEQGVGGQIGIAAGGRVTAGGMRVTGNYLYQLAEHDWFDGIASFTFGSGDPACFRDRSDTVICDHGLAEGGSIELAAGVRRMLSPRGDFVPFVRAAIGIAYVRFGDDDVSGIAVPLHLGAGLRTQVSSGFAITALAELTAGLGRFNRGLGGEPQLGLAVTAGAEFRLK